MRLVQFLSGAKSVLMIALIGACVLQSGSSRAGDDEMDTESQPASPFNLRKFACLLKRGSSDPSTARRHGSPAQRRQIPPPLKPPFPKLLSTFISKQPQPVSMERLAPADPTPNTLATQRDQKLGLQTLCANAEDSQLRGAAGGGPHRPSSPPCLGDPFQRELESLLEKTPYAYAAARQFLPPTQEFAELAHKLYTQLSEAEEQLTQMLEQITELATANEEENKFEDTAVWQLLINQFHTANAMRKITRSCYYALIQHFPDPLDAGDQQPEGEDWVQLTLGQGTEVFETSEEGQENPGPNGETAA